MMRNVLMLSAHEQLGRKQAYSLSNILSVTGAMEAITLPIVFNKVMFRQFLHRLQSPFFGKSNNHAFLSMVICSAGNTSLMIGVKATEEYPRRKGAILLVSCLD